MKATKWRFVGYSTHPRGYRLLNKASKKVVIRRDISFNEANFEDMEEPPLVRSSAVLEKASRESVTSGEAEAP